MENLHPALTKTGKLKKEIERKDVESYNPFSIYPDTKT